VADGFRFLLVHGSPRRINEYLYPDKPDATFARIGAAAGADVVVCGHTHRPYDKEVGVTRFVNVGSAGKPKDGDPRACWALIETGPRGVAVTFRRVEYDIERSIEAIIASELPLEFADQLREARGYRQPSLV
jgi:diadenosine tetraphosphatase ApaH/serine/threonine PP2A family protein phosphatase